MGLSQPWSLGSTLTSSLPKAALPFLTQEEDLPPGRWEATGCTASSVLNIIINWKEVQCWLNSWML